jgi:hypothetical protein
VAKQLVFTDRFKRNDHALPRAVQKRFDNALRLFLQDPKHPSLNVHRYQTESNVWEAYVTMAYRFTFSITEDSMIFRNIGPHRIIDRGQV